MKRVSVFTLVMMLFACAALAQVQVDASIDSVQMFIGEQTYATLKVTLDAKQKVEMPDIKKGQMLVPDVEVLDIMHADTSYLNEGRRIEVVQRYLITAWDSSLYYLPPFEVKVDGKSYSSPRLALKVYTMDVDTLHTDRFNPPRGVMKPPFDWNDWNAIFWVSFALIFMLLSSHVLSVRVRTGKPFVRIIRRKKKLPPHQVAMQEIERIKQTKNLTQEEGKAYYTQLTDALRTYIRERYGFNALEMTSGQIIERLLQENDEEALGELREIFRTADLVKFAKYIAQDNENDANLVAAVEYINQTKVEPDPNAKPEPEIVKETDHHRQNQVIAMRVVILVFSCLSVAALLWILWRVCDLII